MNDWKLWRAVMMVVIITLFSGCSRTSTNHITTEDKEIKEQKIHQEQQQNQQESLTEQEEKEKTPAEQKQETISNKITSMTLEEKVGQMLFLAFRNFDGTQNVTVYNDAMAETIKIYQPGGIILFGENIDTEQQTKQLIDAFQKESNIPLFIGVDEEGGRVSRLNASGKIDAPKIPPASELAKPQDGQLVYDSYNAIGAKLLELGFNLDFAPVADINTNSKNVVIGDRAFGKDAKKVGVLVEKAVEGLEAAGISSTLKHFPGHGDTSTDTHTEETFVSHTLERLKSTEFIPFLDGIKAGAKFIMVAHIKAPKVTSDNLPASLSKDMIQGILREQLQFQGIVITDALDMAAITNDYDSATAAVLAVNAGVDILLMPEDIDKAKQAILDAVADGQISEQRINESVERILTIKYEKGLWESFQNS